MQAPELEHPVVLVDTNDRPIGEMGKLEVHERGLLHRAFSVFVFNDRGELMLQRRAESKYHSGGLWSNTCCSHPQPGEIVQNAAHRRLWEEMRLECDIQPHFTFVYRAELDRGLVEHEYDHVFVGRTDRTPDPDPAEVADWRWTPVDVIRRELEERPGDFTSWFRICFDRAVR
ncbi:MAG: isopentenyl-diphosphate Delta-isomerase [Rhodothermales bacterium]|nr:isopentenyl-diphosphate Delta-isomerase [Rhodothermales bacterium]